MVLGFVSLVVNVSSGLRTFFVAHLKGGKVVAQLAGVGIVVSAASCSTANWAGSLPVGVSAPLWSRVQSCRPVVRVGLVAVHALLQFSKPAIDGALGLQEALADGFFDFR